MCATITLITFRAFHQPLKKPLSPQQLLRVPTPPLVTTNLLSICSSCLSNPQTRVTEDQVPPGPALPSSAMLNLALSLNGSVGL